MLKISSTIDILRSFLRRIQKVKKKKKKLAAPAGFETQNNLIGMNFSLSKIELNYSAAKPHSISFPENFC